MEVMTLELGPDHTLVLDAGLDEIEIRLTEDFSTAITCVDFKYCSRLFDNSISFADRAFHFRRNKKTGCVEVRFRRPNSGKEGFQADTPWDSFSYWFDIVTGEEEDVW